MLILFVCFVILYFLFPISLYEFERQNVYPLLFSKSISTRASLFVASFSFRRPIVVFVVVVVVVVVQIVVFVIVVVLVAVDFVVVVVVDVLVIVVNGHVKLSLSEFRQRSSFHELFLCSDAPSHLYKMVFGSIHLKSSITHWQSVLILRSSIEVKMGLATTHHRAHTSAR